MDGVIDKFGSVSYDIEVVGCGQNAANSREDRAQGTAQNVVTDSSVQKAPILIQQAATEQAAVVVGIIIKVATTIHTTAIYNDYI